MFYLLLPLQHALFISNPFDSLSLLPFAIAQTLHLVLAWAQAFHKLQPEKEVLKLALTQMQVSYFNVLSPQNITFLLIPQVILVPSSPNANALPVTHSDFSQALLIFTSIAMRST